MSLERYVSNQNIQREVEAQRKPYQSPIRAFANMMIEDAVTELVSLDRGKNSPMRSAITADRPNNRRHIGDWRKDVETMIYFANIVIAMENSIIDGEYNHVAFCDNINESIGSYAKYENDFIEEPGESQKYTPEEKIQESKFIAKVAQSDPTFTPFVEFPDELLPGPLLEVLEAQEMKDRIQVMARNYKRVSRRLLQKRSTAYSLREIQELTLSMFDAFIEKVPSSFTNQAFLSDSA